MDFTRIASVVDVPRLQQSHVVLVGAGASVSLAIDLARTGVGTFTLIDFDRVEAVNVARQGHDADEIGGFKVKALGKRIKAINPAVAVHYLAMDFCALTDEMVDRLLGRVDLLILATDRFVAQARGNEVALRLGKPAIWIGLYRGAGAGEIIFWHPGLDACYRCLCSKRYTAQEAARLAGESIDPPSDGATVFDVHYLDSIAGMLSVGLLTRGSNNRFGRLIGQLGDRNFIQVQIDPNYTWGGRDVIREQLGVSESCDSFFAWNAIVRRDPDGGALSCPDCAKFRGHTFGEVGGQPIRLRDGNAPTGTLVQREEEACVGASDPLQQI